MLCDYHVHTIYSDDSVYEMEEVVKDGIKRGIKELCFTDHVDYGIKRDVDDPLGPVSRYIQFPNMKLYLKLIPLILLFFLFIR